MGTANVLDQIRAEMIVVLIGAFGRAFIVCRSAPLAGPARVFPERTFMISQCRSVRG